MEQVTAYKSYNGRLFETAEKCLAYEKKQKQYPKVKEEVEYAMQWDFDKVQNLPFERIEKHIITTRKTPSANRQISIFYVVDGKYKFTDDFNVLDRELMQDIMHPREETPYMPSVTGHDEGINKPRSEYYHVLNIGRILARKLLLGEKIEKAIDEVVTSFREFDKRYAYLECIKVDNKHWTIEDKRWHHGSIRPNRLHVEVIS